MLAVKRDIVDSLVEIAVSNEKFLVNAMNCLRLAIEYGRILLIRLPSKLDY